MRSTVLRLAFFVLASLLIAVSADATAEPLDAERLGIYALVVDGAPAPDARFYRLGGPDPGIIVVSQALPRPVWIKMRSREVMTLDEGSLGAERDDASLRITADGWVADGVLQRGPGGGPGFVVDGHAATIGPAEPITGTFDPETLRQHLPLYAKQSIRHAPRDETVDRLAKAIHQRQEPVRLDVYFGSTCSRCARVMPDLLATESRLREHLEGEELEIVYHGIETGPEAQAEMAAKGVDMLPAAIFSDAASGEEIGRVDPAAWQDPEQGLYDALDSSRPAVAASGS